MIGISTSDHDVILLIITIVLILILTVLMVGDNMDCGKVDWWSWERGKLEWSAVVVVGVERSRS